MTEGIQYSNSLDPTAAEHDQGCKVFVGQVPAGTPEDKLRTIFSEYGTVADVFLLRDRRTSTFKGCAFVTFSSPEEAQSAIVGVEAAQITLDGAKRSLIVHPAGPSGEKKAEPTEHKLYVGMLSRDTTEEELTAMFEPYGEIKEQFLMRDKTTGQSKGMAFIKYTRREDAIRAINALDQKVKDKQAPQQLQVRFAQTPQEKMMKQQQQAMFSQGQGQWGGYGMQQGYEGMMGGMGGGMGMAGMGLGMGSGMGGMGGMGTGMAGGMGGMAGGLGGMAMHGSMGGQIGAGSTQQGPKGANLFVLGLPDYTTDSDLAAMFAGFGTLLSAKVQINLQTQKSKGFGFVSFDNVQAAQAAISSMDGFMLANKRLQVRVKSATAGAKQGMGTAVGMGAAANRFRPY